MPEENTKVTIDFKESKAVLEWAREEAESDERSVSVWLRRLITEEFQKANK